MGSLSDVSEDTARSDPLLLPLSTHGQELRTDPFGCICFAVESVLMKEADKEGEKMLFKDWLFFDLVVQERFC